MQTYNDKGHNMNQAHINRILANHGIEVWHGYAVEQYTINGIPGECFTPLAKLNTLAVIKAWLGY